MLKLEVEVTKTTTTIITITITITTTIIISKVVEIMVIKVNQMIRVKLMREVIKKKINSNNNLNRQ